jgi:uncharacterized protein (TIGR01244 family)
MVKCIEISDKFSVSGQIDTSDLESLKAQGFTVIICNRPDYEDANQMLASDIESRVVELGMQFIHIPISGRGPNMQAVELSKQALDDASGRVLAYCRSGMRSVMLWSLATAMSGGTSADELIDMAASAGFNIDGLRPTLNSLTG